MIRRIAVSAFGLLAMIVFNRFLDSARNDRGRRPFGKLPSTVLGTGRVGVRESAHPHRGHLSPLPERKTAGGMNFLDPSIGLLVELGKAQRLLQLPS
jgi:hypothetical protein